MSLFAYITWTANPVIYDFGFFKLTWYGLLFMSGFVFGTFILAHIYKAEQVAREWVDVITMYMLLGTVLGARLGHCLFYDWAYYSKHPLEIFFVFPWAGLASHGATLGILLTTWLFSRRNKFDYLWVLDRIVIVVAVGGACIRLGNLMNSEIIGRVTNMPWAFQFARYNEIHHELGTIPNELRHPTQIYESLFCIFLFVLLYGIWSRYREQTPRGLLFGLFVTLLFSFRFGVEFLKENQEAFENGMLLNMGQLLSLPMIVVGLWVTWRAGKQKNNPYGYAPRGSKEASEPLSTARLLPE
jgi:phosphatidylglycerol:prolipoprotein diacylglycerol transferase